MKACVLAAALILIGSAGWAQTRTVVASSGAPSFVLAGNPPDLANPTINRLALSSGYLGPGLEQRWTAFQFFVSQPCIINGIEVYWFDAHGPVPTQYGWAIYADNGSNAPGTLLRSGTGNLASLSIDTKGFANTFGAEKAAVFPTGTVSLTRGMYWATVYGVDGNLPLFVGAPGGATNNFAYRKTSTGSPYTPFETNNYCMPNYQGSMDGGWQRLGTGPPYNYSGWNANELPGRCIYRVAYTIVDTSGHNSTYVRGTLRLSQWPDNPPKDYFPGGTGSDPLCLDVHFCDPATGYPQIIETVAVTYDPNTNTSVFTTAPVRNGTYDIKIFLRDYFIGRFVCGSYAQLYYSAFGHPFLGWQFRNITLSGGLFPLGIITLVNGDTNLDALVGLPDLNRVLVNFGASVKSTDGCATEPPWANYYANDDTNYDGDIALSDLNAVLLNFGVSGPTRW